MRDLVGVEREGVRMINPQSDVILEPDAILWIVGNAENVKELKKQCSMPR